MNYKSQQTLLCNLAVGLTVAQPLYAAAPAKKATAPEKPNIVLIMADDLGYRDISCFGSTKIKTPNLDKLAERGVKFTDFHSNGAVSSPTRAGLMTGKYQQRVDVEGVITAANDREKGLDLSEVTMAEEMANLGYTCAMFGKWHLGYDAEFNPVHQGFHEYRGYVSGNVDYHTHIDQAGYHDWWNNDKLEKVQGYTTDLITDYAIEFIERNNPAKTDKPFFLYLPYETPHGPYQRREDAPLREESNVKTIRPEVKEDYPEIYVGMIECLDERLGDLFATLEKEGLTENTIVVFCSDNGANHVGDNGVLRGAKNSVFEGGHRVPGIISYPAKVKAGTVSNETVITMDLLPTFVDIAGGQTTGDIVDGVSLKNLLFKGKKLQDRDLFWISTGQCAMRRGDWKFVWGRQNKQNNLQLYNLKTDISEKNNVALENRELTIQMQQAVKDWFYDVRSGIETKSIFNLPEFE